MLGWERKHWFEFFELSIQSPLWVNLSSHRHSHRLERDGRRTLYRPSEILGFLFLLPPPSLSPSVFGTPRKERRYYTLSFSTGGAEGNRSHTMLCRKIFFWAENSKKIPITSRSSVPSSFLPSNICGWYVLTVLNFWQFWDYDPTFVAVS